MERHAHWMQQCLVLAAHGAGRVSPNPMVGCVLVGPDGQVLGEGGHQFYGGPHAEVNAVANALDRHTADALQNATLYVNLEPCNHHGKTPPCTDLILRYRIPRVVVGMPDPFPEVAGTGLARLRAAGVDVTVGVLEAACRKLNAAYLWHLQTGRPLVTLKMAQTLDGRVAAPSGDARWISGLEARTLVHRWRATLDAVLVGAGTARQDDPELTVRHVEGRQPVRIVLDRTGTLPASLKLFTDAHVPHTLAVTAPTATPAYADALTRAGGRLLRIPVQDGHLNLLALLEALGSSGGIEGRAVQSVMVEAGPGLASALFTQDLVDRFYLFIAPKILGDGRPVLHLPALPRMADARRFAAHEWTPVGEDILFEGQRSPKYVHKDV